MPGTRAGTTREKDNMRKMSEPELRIRVIPAIGDVAAADWDACANPSASMPPGGRFSQRANGVESASMCKGDSSAMLARPAAGQLAVGTPPVATPVDPKAKSVSQDFVFNPFIAHDFLAALEASGSAVARAGGCYYPKLQVSVPFTPATGRRLLARPGSDHEIVQAGLAAGLIELTRLREASSAHLTFLTEPEWRLLGAQGFLQRTDQQFHWENAAYGTFEDFLAALAARKRKIIRRERRDGVPADVTVHWLTGSDLTEAAWDAFFAFYMETGSRKWGRPYLTRSFFSLVSEKMRERILLVMAKR